MLVVKKAGNATRPNLGRWIGTDALHQYFRRVVAHAQADPRVGDAAFCYCSIPMAVIRYRHTVEVRGMPCGGVCFYDDPENGLNRSRHIEDPSGEWVRILVHDGYGEVVVGFYNPTTHTLLATDWVHDFSSERSIHYIAEQMGWQKRPRLAEEQEAQDGDAPILLGADPEW